MTLAVKVQRKKIQRIGYEKYLKWRLNGAISFHDEEYYNDKYNIIWQRLYEVWRFWRTRNKSTCTYVLKFGFTFNLLKLQFVSLKMWKSILEFVKRLADVSS